MISQLKGTIEAVDAQSAVVDVGGVGYEVHMTGTHLAGLMPGDDVVVYTHMAVRENSQELFGFRSREELRIFEMLISVSGIGPKSALSILNVTTIDTLKQAVHSEDVSPLTRISGIGKKIAEKIVIELRGKFDDFEESIGLKDEIDAMEALRSLGYSQKESQDALKQVPREIVGTPERVRRALKHLTS